MSLLLRTLSLQHIKIFNVTSSQLKPWLSIGIRSYSSKTKELSLINKQHEIKGYFVEDFNVKGKIHWRIFTGFTSFILVYLATSCVTWISLSRVISSESSIDFINHLRIFELVDYLNLYYDDDPKYGFILASYLGTEPLRLYGSWKLRKPITSLLYKLNIYKHPKYKPYKDEKNYDEEKIERL